MSCRRTNVLFCLCLIAFEGFGVAQKVKVGYDTGIDFSKYKTYTWAAPTMPPTRPLLYATVISAIDGELSSKGFTRTDKEGDLVLTAAGGVDFATAVSGGTPLTSTFSGPPPSVNTTMWTGTEGRGQLMAVVPEGTLVVELVDRIANQLVWSGTVTENLNIEQKNKSLDLAGKAVAKLLKQFPPKGRPKK